MSKTLVVGSKDVSKLLTMADCIKVVRETFRAQARGEATFPLRRTIPQPDKKGLLGMMPGFLDNEKILGMKAISVFPGNLGTKFESHQGAVLLFEAEHGQLLGVVDASSITAVRTAAASGVATDLLAKKDVKTMGILGSGSQAATHLESMTTVRKGLERVRVWSRNPDHARAFAKRMSGRFGVPVEAKGEAQGAVEGSDLVCTVTGAKAPILNGAWLSPGVHVNAVGASVPPFRELDTEAVARSRFFVDSRESALNESEDLNVPIREGAVDQKHLLGEIGEVLEGRVQGRTGPTDITIFKSLGLAIEDLAAANFVYKQAAEKGAGTWVELGGERESR